MLLAGCNGQVGFEHLPRIPLASPTGLRSKPLGEADRTGGASG